MCARCRCVHQSATLQHRRVKSNDIHDSRYSQPAKATVPGQLVDECGAWATGRVPRPSTALGGAPDTPTGTVLLTADQVRTRDRMADRKKEEIMRAKQKLELLSLTKAVKKELNQVQFSACFSGL
jgi:hypothetical protein